jgi:beta-mannosidase
MMLLEKQVRQLFGTVPDNAEDFILASQISQAEANKYFLERARTNRPEKTGIIWWNLLDGWPQFSDAVVDYYYCRKQAFFTIKRSQEAVCLMFRDPTKSEGKLELIGVNEFPEDKDVSYKVTNLETDEVVMEGSGTVGGNGAIVLGAIDTIPEQTCLLITYMVDGKEYKNHYLTGIPTYDYKKVCEWLDKAGLLNFEGFNN